jgi:hypothetical protein
MTISGDLDDFAAGHRAHGQCVTDIGALTPNGYRLRVVCPCGVRFERWITPEETASDLAIRARIN